MDGRARHARRIGKENRQGLGDLACGLTEEGVMADIGAKLMVPEAGVSQVL